MCCFKVVPCTHFISTFATFASNCNFKLPSCLRYSECRWNMVIDISAVVQSYSIHSFHFHICHIYILLQFQTPEFQALMMCGQTSRNCICICKNPFCETNKFVKTCFGSNICKVRSWVCMNIAKKKQPHAGKQINFQCYFAEKDTWL